MTDFLAFAFTLALTRPSAGSLLDRYGEGAVIAPALLFAMVAPVVCSLPVFLWVKRSLAACSLAFPAGEAT